MDDKSGKITSKVGLTPIGDTFYKRPNVTYTDKINKDKEKIIDKLEDYVKVDDIFKVPLGTHLRYYKNENGEKKFVLGGKLINNNGLPKYIILTNGKVTWSVQLDTVITFFRKMTIKEIKDEYEDVIIQLEEKNENYKKLIKTQQDEINKLKDFIETKFQK